VQNSINRIETVYGQIKYKYAKGTESCQILKRIKDAAQIQEGPAPGQPEAEIDCLIMLDREVDLVSPLCVNMTYEGALDEYFGIKTCSITVDTSIIKPDAAKEGKDASPPTQTLVLTNEDEIFREVRDKHFNTLEGVFSKKCREIQSIVKDKDAP
jgi:hypothetical protein